MNLTDSSAGPSTSTPKPTDSSSTNRKRAISFQQSRSEEIDAPNKKKRPRLFSTSSNEDLDLENIFIENQMSQRENNALMNEVLTLQKEKYEEKMDIDIEASKLELEKKKIELETARKQHELADLKVKKLKESVEK